MSQNCVVPMESYRLAQYAVPIPCFICGNDNAFDTELCLHCQAPMALAHQAGGEKVQPQMIAAVGSAGAGKTVYLGMLMDMLSRENERLQVLARGAFSISLQQMTVAALSRCEFPTKTPNEPDRWNWVHCQVQIESRRRPLELIMPDMAGDALMEEVEHPHSYPVIRSFLGKCAGVMVMIDAAQIEEGAKGQDFQTLKILSYLSELSEHRQTSRPGVPVALVFSKADQCDSCFEDPAAFAQRKTPGLWQHCQERMRRHQFFAVGVAGACSLHPEFAAGSVRVPLRIEPRGVIEPFHWLVQQIKK